MGSKHLPRGLLRTISVLVVLAVMSGAKQDVSAQGSCPPDLPLGVICQKDGCEGSCRDDGGSDSDDEIGDVVGGCSVSDIPVEGDGATCTYYCHDDRLSFMYTASLGIWVVNEADSVINGENEITSLNGVPICNWTLAEEPPCTTISISPSGEITCGGDFSVTASARVPCMTVLRDPYPRGLVSVPNIFWLNGPWSTMGSASSLAWCTPTIRNYTLQVGWQFFPAIPPTWFFDERSWSPEPQYSSGMGVMHTYQTSSWGLPENGPSLEGVLGLPAYQVRVGTAWQALIRRTWEEGERGNRLTFDCGAGETECQRLYAMCEEPGTDSENDLCFEWNWVPHDTGWIPLDLTQYGYPHSYYVSWAAGDVTMPPPGIRVVPLGQRLCNVPVPIIEAQALLNSPANQP